MRASRPVITPAASRSPAGWRPTSPRRSTPTPWAARTGSSATCCRSTSRRSCGSTRTSSSASSAMILAIPPATVFLTRNIGDSTIKGVDLDVDLKATPNTLLSASVQYLHGKYDSFTYFVPNQGLPPNSTCAFAPDHADGQRRPARALSRSTARASRRSTRRTGRSF